MPMRKRGEDEIDVVERLLLELLDHGIADKPPRGADAPPRPPARPCCRRTSRGLELRMRGNQPQQLAADIAGGSKDGSPNHRRRPIHVIAFLCKHMHINAHGRSEGTTAARDRRPDPRPVARPIRKSLRSVSAHSASRSTQATISRDLEQIGAAQGPPQRPAELRASATRCAAAPTRASRPCSATGCARSNPRPTSS